jgi:hypothetical protein
MISMIKSSSGQRAEVLSDDRLRTKYAIAKSLGVRVPSATCANIFPIRDRIAKDARIASLLSSEVIDQLAMAMACVIDNETGWTLQRECGWLSDNTILHWVHDIYGYGPGTDSVMNAKKKWIGLGNVNLARSTTGDAFRYRGGGWIQLTGRTNYINHAWSLLTIADASITTVKYPSNVLTVINAYAGQPSSQIARDIAPAHIDVLMNDPDFAWATAMSYSFTNHFLNKIKGAGLDYAADRLFAQEGYGAKDHYNKRGALSPGRSTMMSRLDIMKEIVSDSVTRGLVSKQE